jgi:hypothetical protein
MGAGMLTFAVTVAFLYSAGTIVVLAFGRR